MPDVINRGRLINFLNGITGVSSNAQAVVNLDVGKRYHRNELQCTAVNYAGINPITGLTTQATTALTGAGINLTVTATIVNGTITAVVVVVGGTGYVTGDTITIVDTLGAGFVGTVTAAAGVVTAVAITSVGSPTPSSPRNVLNSVRQLVNGVNMRDITPLNTIKIAQANGLQIRRGTLPLFYSTPWRDHLARNDTTAWDLFGQSTFQIQFGITAVTNPGIVGSSEFDGFQNTRDNGNGQTVRFLEPTSQHEFTWPIVAGRNDITTIPYNFPVSRLWLQGSVPGNIFQVEVYQDRNKVLEGTTAQILSMYEDYGFQFGLANFQNNLRANFFNNGLTAAALLSQYEAPAYYDAAYISDPDGRWSKRLVVGSSLLLRVYSNVAQSLTIVGEFMPGAYIG
jgi:hypothetical protein